MIYILIVADALMLAAFIFRFQSLPPQIPLFYSQAWGQDQLVDYWQILILPALLHIFFFLNIYLYNRLFFPDHFVRKIIAVSNIAVTVVLSLIFLKILFYVS